jgi:hypothetical protein
MSEISSAYPFDVDFDVEEEKSEGERFRVLDDGAASWAFRRLAEAEAEIESRRALARSEIETVERWLADAVKGPERSRAYFEALLVGYMARRFGDDPKTKTISLPSGTLTARAGTPKIEVDDVEAFFEFADGVADSLRPEYVREKIEANVSALKKRLVVTADGVLVEPETGEPVPGLGWIPGGVRFAAKTAAPEVEEELDSPESVTPAS